MAPRISLALLCVLVVIAAGCGSSGKSGTTGGSGSTSTASQATTSTSTGPDHFTAAQWSKYQKDAAAFKKLNTTTLAKVSACAKPVQSGKHAGAVKVCVGDSLDKLFTATATLGRTLIGFTGTVSGDCETALNSLIGYVVPYQASIKQLQTVIDAGNPTVASGAVDNLNTARTSGQEAAAAVSKSCAPA